MADRRLTAFPMRRTLRLAEPFPALAHNPPGESLRRVFSFSRARAVDLTSTATPTRLVARIHQEPRMFWLSIAALAAVLHFDNRLRKIMSSQAQHAQDLRDLKTQHDKAAAEQAAALAKLQAALDAAGATTPEVDAAMADLKASIQAEDDLNPDA